MCWCTPSLRTPFCGKPGCVRPAAIDANRPIAKVIAAKGIVNDIFADNDAMAQLNNKRPRAEAREAFMAIVIKHLDAYDQRQT